MTSYRFIMLDNLPVGLNINNYVKYSGHKIFQIDVKDSPPVISFFRQV